MDIQEIKAYTIEVKRTGPTTGERQGTEGEQPVVVPRRLAVNDRIEVRLEKDDWQEWQAMIYVGGKRIDVDVKPFVYYDFKEDMMFPRWGDVYDASLLRVPESVDEIIVKYQVMHGELSDFFEFIYSKKGKASKFSVSPDEEFFVACSNMQAWCEHGYDTRLLHAPIAIPVLRALVAEDDEVARTVLDTGFTERLAKENYEAVLAVLGASIVKDKGGSQCILSKDALDAASRHPHPDVRCKVASIVELPYDIIDRLVHDENLMTRLHASYQLIKYRKQFENLAFNQEPEIRLMVARNRETPPRILQAMAEKYIAKGLDYTGEFIVPFPVVDDETKERVLHGINPVLKFVYDEDSNEYYHSNEHYRDIDGKKVENVVAFIRDEPNKLFGHILKNVYEESIIDSDEKGKWPLGREFLDFYFGRIIESVTKLWKEFGLLEDGRLPEGAETMIRTWFASTRWMPKELLEALRDCDKDEIVRETARRSLEKTGLMASTYYRRLNNDKEDWFTNDTAYQNQKEWEIITAIASNPNTPEEIRARLSIDFLARRNKHKIIIS